MIWCDFFRSSWVGISRYGLLDVRVVLSRAAVYATLTVLVAALYLGAVAALDDVLPAAAATLAEALRLRYVALLVDGATLAEHGSRTQDPLVRLMLPFAGSEVGSLGAATSARHRPRHRPGFSMVTVIGRRPPSRSCAARPRRPCRTSGESPTT